jgi:hypothetical protein
MPVSPPCGRRRHHVRVEYREGHREVFARVLRDLDASACVDGRLPIEKPPRWKMRSIATPALGEDRFFWGRKP